MNQPKNLLLKLASLVATAGCLSAYAQTSIPASYTRPVSSVNTAKPGFLVRTVQGNTGSGTLTTSNARAEAQLAGVLIDPLTNLPYVNTALPGDLAGGYFSEPNLINYEQSGGSAGNFEGDLFYPGLPGSDDQNANDNFAIEAITYLQLKAGLNRFGVNSDDGFRVTLSSGDPRDQLSSIELGTYDGGRGVGDTTFDFTVPADGIYAARLVQYEGGGGAAVEWFSVDTATDEKILINDVSNPKAVKAYQEATGAAQPFVKLAAPAPGAKNVTPGTILTFLLQDNGTAVATNTVQLSFDGAVVPATIKSAGGTTTVTFDPPGLMEQQSTHTVKLTFANNAAAPVTRTAEYSFTVANFGNIQLPTPLFFENFESVNEGEVPAGWTLSNQTTGASGEFDLDSPGSDSYLDWVVISRQRVIDVGTAGRWESGRRLNTPELYVNGAQVTNLVTGKFLYAESDTRGGTQYQIAISPDYNLTAKSNIFLSFHSAYEQNQDSIGSVEYSIDGGASWLPILYMIDAADIIVTNGVTDAWATLTAPRTDTANIPDPITGEEGAKPYGAFIGAVTNLWPTFEPYISGRINDDPIESKRVELFRLPKADNQAKVRLRFAQAGTGSWYFGIDDLGIYSITKVATPPTIATQPAGGAFLAGSTVTLKVTAQGPSLTYQWQFNGTNIAGATGATLALANVQPANSGKYSVTIKNSDGTLVSKIAFVSVTAGPTPNVKTDLVTYLPFDNNLNDLSGRGNNGTAVGTPAFAAGKLGAGAVSVTSLKDGSSFNYVTLGAPADLEFGTTVNFSVSFWTKLNEWTGDPSFIGNKNWNSGSNPGWVIATAGDAGLQWNLAGKPDGATGDRKDFDSAGGVLADKGWHHVVSTFDRKGVGITYLDGVPLGTASGVTETAIATPANNLSTPSGNAVNIGQDGVGTYTDGNGVGNDKTQIDDLAIWRRVLPPEEVAAIYLKGQAGKSLLVDPVTPAGLSLAVSVTGGNATLTVTGGTAPFLLQMKSSLSDTGWINVQTTSARTIVLPKAGASAFFRVQDNATTTVTLYRATLTSGAEVPPTGSTGSGAGFLALEGDKATYVVGYSGLTGNPTAAHIHGPAPAGVTAGVVFPITASGTLGTSGLYSGVLTLSTDQKTALAAGLAYFNIHTAVNGGGEIRGQILP